MTHKIEHMNCPRCNDGSTTLLNKRGMIHDWYCHHCAYCWDVLYLRNQAIILEDGFPGIDCDVEATTNHGLLAIGPKIEEFNAEKSFEEDPVKKLRRMRRYVVRPKELNLGGVPKAVQYLFDAMKFVLELIIQGEHRNAADHLYLATSNAARMLNLGREDPDRMYELSQLYREQHPWPGLKAQGIS